LVEFLSQYWYAFPVVALGCTLTIMGGVGGNLICGPFFILVLKLAPEAAIGTALFTEVFSMSSGVVGYSRTKLIDYKCGLILASAAVPSAIIGSILSAHSPGTLLKVIFGASIAIIAVFLRRSPSETDLENASLAAHDNSPEHRRLIDREGREYRYSIQKVPLGLMLSSIAGLGSGLVGIGGGEINTPSLVFRCRMPVRVAAATSVFVMGMTVIAGAGTHALAGRPVWSLLVWSVPGAILGGQIGSHLASRINPNALTRWLSILFFAVGAAMMATAYLG
jgi:hypothetical protein